jgi:hypothetical protein
VYGAEYLLEFFCLANECDVPLGLFAVGIARCAIRPQSNIRIDPAFALRTRQVPAVEVAVPSARLQDDGAVGHPLQVGQALRNAKDDYAAGALAVCLYERIGSLGMSGASGNSQKTSRTNSHAPQGSTIILITCKIVGLIKTNSSI